MLYCTCPIFGICKKSLHINTVSVFSSAWFIGIREMSRTHNVRHTAQLHDTLTLQCFRKFVCVFYDCLIMSLQNLSSISIDDCQMMQYRILVYLKIFFSLNAVHVHRTKCSTACKLQPTYSYKAMALFMTKTCRRFVGVFLLVSYFHF